MSTKTTKEISTTDLINYQYGLASNQRRSEISQALIEDEFVHLQYQGIKALDLAFPDEDREAILDQAAEELLLQIPKLKNQGIQGESKNTDKKDETKYTSGQKDHPAKPGLVLPLWTRYLAAASVVCVLGIALYNNQFVSTSAPDTQMASNKDAEIPQEELHSNEPKGENNQPIPTKKPNLIASRSETEEPAKKFSRQTTEGEELSQNANTTSQIPMAVQEQIKTMLNKDAFELKGKVKSDLNISESKRKAPHLTKDFKEGKYRDVVSALESYTNLTGNESFCLGYAMLKSSKPDYQSAEQFLSKAYSSSDVKKDAAYYLGIAQVFQGKRSEAVNSLEHSDRPEAEAILKLLAL